MGKSRNIASRDAVAMIRLGRETRDCALRGDSWQTHFISGLTAFFRAKMGVATELGGIGPLLQPALAKPIDVGHLTPDERRGFLHYLQDDHAADPMLKSFSRLGPRLHALDRRNLVPDRAWYRSRHYNEYRSIARVDHCLYASVPLRDPHWVFSIGIHREKGDSPLHATAQPLVTIAMESIADLAVARCGPSRLTPDTLPPRLRPVLFHLVQGRSEKQIASELDLTQSTIHQYVKLLHRQYKVSNRAELIAKVSGVL